MTQWPMRLLSTGVFASEMTVPYYAFLKVSAAALHAVLPGGVPPEVIYRLPSVAVSVLAAGVLAVWLVRWCSPWLVVAAEAALVTTGGFSRYGQEARPYAFALAAAVVSTVLWARLAQVAPPSGVRRAAGRGVETRSGGATRARRFGSRPPGASAAGGSASSGGGHGGLEGGGGNIVN